MAPSNDETSVVFPEDPGQPSAAGSGPLPNDPRDTAADTSREFEAVDVEPALTAADQATVEALHAGSALLLVQRGPTSGARFLLDADVTTVGRSPGNDIFLDDVTVSRKHAEFRRGGGVFSVRDVGSLNGTYVGKDRIDGEVPLRTGDEVQVGKFRFLFQQSQQPQPAQTAQPAQPGPGSGGR